MREEWRTFTSGIWEKEINVRDFIQRNYSPYDGDDSFLEGPTDDTKALWDQVMKLSEEERKRGIRMLGKRIANLHVFHWDASGRRPLSEGKEEWKGYTKALCDDFSGYALMEFVKDDAPEQFLEDAAALSSWLSQS